MKHRPLIFVLIIYILSSIWILINFDGVGNEADSITHFLIAKYAPQHPYLFLDHWGKPIFTLLASPFAQFGFTGIKVFNILCGGINLILIYLISEKLNLKFGGWAAFFYFLSPITISTLYTGLTEALFAAVLLTSVYLMLKKKINWSLILVSFLPFIRSEGLLILLVFGAYQIFHKDYKSVSLLGIGHILFACLGALYYQDLLWVFNRIPYASLNSPYGSGEWYHFIDKTPYILGIPLAVLMGLGILIWFKELFIDRKFQLKAFDLIPISFLAFFLAHSIFWRFGIFNSMGLKRVFGGVSPLMLIICFYGAENLLKIMPIKLQRASKWIGLGLILLFPFTSNPAAIDFNKYLNLSEKQKEIQQVELETNGKVLVYADPYLSMAFDINPFDPNQHLYLNAMTLKSLPQNSMVIWDDWHARNLVHEIETLEKASQLKLVKDVDSYYKIYSSQ